MWFLLVCLKKILYIHEEDLNSNNVPFEKEIKEALDSLFEG